MSRVDIPGRPPVHAGTPWHFPEPEVRHLPNGLQVWAYRLPGQYVLSMELVFDVALMDEPAGKEGLAMLALRCCDEGTLPHPGSELARRIEDIGAVFDGTASWWGTHCALGVAAPHASQGLGLLAEIVRQPAYADQDVERHKALRVAEIDQARVSSPALAAAGLREAMWAPGSRQSIAPGGRSGTVAALRAADVRDFHDAWWRPDGATLVLAGDLPDGLIEEACELFGVWPATGLRPQRDAPRPAGGAMPLHVVDRPGSVAADLRISTVTPGRRDPDWAPLQVATMAAGGLFGSRLNLVLREERGYTYGVQAGLSAGRFAGTFGVQASFRTEVAAQAVREAVELLDIDERPFTDEEAGDAIRYLVGIAPLRYDTAEAIAEQAGVLAAHRMAPGWVDTLHGEIRRTSAPQASAAFARRVSTAVRERLARIVICGDAGQLVPGLESAGFAVEVVSPEL